MMTTRELLETASLDALGLLDEEEREAFEVAFREAAPAVQAQIRREQLRFTEMDRMLPDVEAPAGLRARVLAAVREAIAAVSSHPIEESPIVGAGVLGLTVRATPVWRAACIGFATATVVLAASFAWMTQQNRQMAQINGSAELIDQIHSNLGPRALDILPAADRTVVFAATDAMTAGVEAKLFIDEDTGKAILITDGLPQTDAEYRLVIRNADDAPTRLEGFRSSGGVMAMVVDELNPTTVANMEIHGTTEDGKRERVLLKVSGV